MEYWRWGCDIEEPYEGKPQVRFCEGLALEKYGCDNVAPSGNQTANREYKQRPIAFAVSSLLDFDFDDKDNGEGMWARVFCEWW